MAEKYNDLRYIQQPASELWFSQWVDIVNLNKQALSAAYQETPSFLDNYSVQKAAGLDNVSEYQRRLVNPSAEQSARNTQQLLENPWVTMALDGRRLLAVTYTVDNTSGPNAEARMALPAGMARWLKIGWVAARPEVQGTGLASSCVAMAIARSQWLQPISAYAYPGEKSHRLLLHNGLRPQEDAIDVPTNLPVDAPMPTRHYSTGTSKADIIRTTIATKSRAKLKRFIRS